MPRYLTVLVVEHDAPDLASARRWARAAVNETRLEVWSYCEHTAVATEQADLVDILLDGEKVAAASQRRDPLFPQPDEVEGTAV